MSSYAQVQKTIEEITNDLYPSIDVLMLKVSTFKKTTEDRSKFETAFDIFDLLKDEIQSLKKYELKLVFPGINRYFGEMDSLIPQNIRINELHDLLKKKEECIKAKVLELDVELDECNCPLEELVIYMKEYYFCKKDAFYKCIAKIQKERVVKSEEQDILEPDSLPL